MKVLFAVSNEEISEAIVKRYQKQYKEIISYKNVYYFNAILKEIQKDKTYDRIVISEELEAFTNTQYEQIDRFIFDKLDSISDEAANSKGDNTPIILICSDRRQKGEEMLVKLFGIGIYDALIGNDRGVEEVCNLIYKPRSKKEAKMYYKVESDEVKYQSENENDVSEQEIQNILAHYKKLGKNEEKYVTSFDNIVAQYNDSQLRIISKFLPLNVRAVLEEKSPKYQQVMSFNNAVTDSIRKPKNKEQDLGPSGKLLRPKNKTVMPTEPIIIPSAVDTNNVKKLTRNSRAQQETNELNYNNVSENEMNNNQNREVYDPFALNNMQFDSMFGEEPKRRGRKPKKIEEDSVFDVEPSVSNAPSASSVHNVEQIVQNVEQPAPKRRGRPRKNPISEPVDDNILPGFETINESTQNSDIDYNNNGDYSDDTILPGFGAEPQVDYNNDSVLPGFENEVDNKKSSQTDFDYDNSFEDDEPENDPYNNNQYSNPFDNNQYNNPFDNNESEEDSYNNQFGENQYMPNNMSSYSNSNYSNMSYSMEAADLSRLLTDNKKIATFVGTSKNGTSFIVNNLAEYASSMGINVAIFDTTKNKNSYYIYTKNEEELRQIAGNCLQNLSNGQAKGISVNRNLTVYTSLPEDREELNNVNSILETLVRVHDLVLIDCDFDTPLDYFACAQEIYLVQSYDILTIQPLTAFLRELKAKNILDQNKLRILLNKHVKVRGISEKTIVGGMSKYNDPAMSFMTDLFDVNIVKYMTIQFEQDIYTRYLESIINCDISIKGYSKTFMQTLRELNNWVYQSMPGNNSYRPQNTSYNPSFSPSMNNTLNQMKRKY